MFNLNNFIAQFVTSRQNSMFDGDIKINEKALFANIKNASVLVIGGAGTIGSSFIRALLPFEPKSLVVVDINENGLTELTRDIRSTDKWNVPQDYVTYPMDYNTAVFKKMFRNRGGFDIVANFSAHKHVRSEKDIYSIQALLENNVINARNLLELLKTNPPKHFFCVSTDKAANPVNIMGASKKIMEDMIFAYTEHFKITTARFANVAFSNGSLPDGFLKRIEKHQPISAPRDITRYFVSPDESGQICLVACILGQNGEVFFPKLEEKQVRTFSQIATDLLEQKGYKTIECDSEKMAIEKSLSICQTNLYPVLYSGADTNGEKPYEEFFTTTEIIDIERFKALGVVTELSYRKTPDQITELFHQLKDIFEDDKATKAKIVETMADFLGNFEHIEKGKNLDSKM